MELFAAHNNTWEISGDLARYHSDWGKGTTVLSLANANEEAMPQFPDSEWQNFFTDVYLTEGDQFKVCRIAHDGIWTDACGFKDLLYIYPHAVNPDANFFHTEKDMELGGELSNIRVSRSGHYYVYLCIRRDGTERYLTWCRAV